MEESKRDESEKERQNSRCSDHPTHCLISPIFQSRSNSLSKRHMHFISYCANLGYLDANILAAGPLMIVPSSLTSTPLSSPSSSQVLRHVYNNSTESPGKSNHRSPYEWSPIHLTFSLRALDPHQAPGHIVAQALLEKCRVLFRVHN